jgi:hypothetical protein
MLEIDGIAAVLLLFLWVYSIIDVISTDSVLIRNLPKTMWLMIVFFIPDIGSLVWLLLGRPEGAGFWPGGEPRSSTSESRTWRSHQPSHERVDADAVSERDQLIARWAAEDAARKDAQRELADRETAVRRREAELRLIEQRIAEREAQRAERAKGNGDEPPLVPPPSQHDSDSV